MFTGNEDQSITLSEGAIMTKRFRDQMASHSDPDPTISVYVSRKSLEALLANMTSGAVGARFHFGLDEDMKRALVFNPVDANENDLIGSTYFIGDRSYKSPPHTGAANVLNS